MMGKLTTRARKNLDVSQFALPGRRYPIHNVSHARNALARVSQFGTPAMQMQVRQKVYAKYPHLAKGQKK